MRWFLISNYIICTSFYNMTLIGTLIKFIAFKYAMSLISSNDIGKLLRRINPTYRDKISQMSKIVKNSQHWDFESHFQDIQQTCCCLKQEFNKILLPKKISGTNTTNSQVYIQWIAFSTIPLIMVT